MQPMRPMASAVSCNFNVDRIIEDLRNVRPGGIKTENSISEKQLLDLSYAAKDKFLQEKSLLRLQAPVVICGDIHGHYADLLKIFHTHGFPNERTYLFLGDYVDRGTQSVETLALLFAYKVKNPDRIFLLRGNHESSSVNMIYGFYDECKRKYTVRLWHSFVAAYETLPIAAVVSEKIFACHGGISPDLVSLSQIEKIQRPVKMLTDRLVKDLLWSDPSDEISMFASNTQRGISVVFGADALVKFLDDNDLDLLVRAHEVVEDGYAFFGNMKLVTIFSAPNYCGDTGNLGAILEVDADLMCKFHKMRIYFHRKRERKTFGYDLRRLREPATVVVPSVGATALSDAGELRASE